MPQRPGLLQALSTTQLQARTEELDARFRRDMGQLTTRYDAAHAALAAALHARTES